MCEFTKVIKELSAFRPEQSNVKKRVGNYVLGKVIGEGAFAKVRVALHCVTGEKVAVKVINKRAISKRDYLQRHMRREATLLHRLSHVNICRLFETMETANSYYLVMELAEGGELRKYVNKKKALSESEARRYMRQLVSAVDHMHTAGVLHRDLKIDNLLLDGNYNLKIIDFGLSTALDGQSPLTTQCGSAAYAAPEILAGQNYGPAVDVWSLGVNLYALLTGSVPFTAESNNLTKLHAAILRGPRIPPTLTRDCQDLLRKLLEPADLKRITIKEIMTHPWINAGSDRPLKSSHVTRKRTPDDADPRIVRYIAQKCGVAEGEVWEAVNKGKLNAIGGTYNIFMHRQNRGILVPLSDSCQSPDRLLPSQDQKDSHQKDSKSNTECSTGTFAAPSAPSPSVALPKTLNKTSRHLDGQIMQGNGNIGNAETQANNNHGNLDNKLDQMKHSSKLPDVTQPTISQTLQTEGLITKSKPSDSYRECIKQLKERSMGANKGILKPQSGRSDKSRSSDRSRKSTSNEKSVSISSRDFVRLSFEGVHINRDDCLELQVMRTKAGQSPDVAQRRQKGVHFTMSRGDSARLDNKYLVSRLSTAQTTSTDRHKAKHSRFIPELTFKSKSDLTSSRSSRGSFDLIERINNRERLKAQKIMAQMGSNQTVPPPPPPNSALGHRVCDDEDEEYTNTTIEPILPVTSITKVRTAETCCGDFQLKINIVERLPNGGLPARSKSMPEFSVRKLGTVPKRAALPFLEYDYERIPWWTEGKLSIDYLYENQLPRV